LTRFDRPCTLNAGEQIRLPARPTILVVDDDKDTRDILDKVLSSAGYDVRLATNGREALASVGASPPDLIVLDLNMPEMNGFEVLRELRANTRWTKIPVVVVTAIAGYSAAQLGARATLLKPFNILDVQAAIRMVLPPALW
jgi:CheY-like chemotaxis protein